MVAVALVEHISGVRSLAVLPLVLLLVLHLVLYLVWLLQTDVLLEVEDLYLLLVELPEAVDEDSASATFNRKKRRLTVRLDVL